LEDLRIESKEPEREREPRENLERSQGEDSSDRLLETTRSELTREDGGRGGPGLCLIDKVT
jgi:hypothetical protein